MAKRLSENEKREIVKQFSKGISLEELSDIYNSTKITILRNLKKILGEEKYNKLNNNNEKSKIKKLSIKNNPTKKNSKAVDNKNLLENNIQPSNNFFNQYDSQTSDSEEFVELAPLDYEIDNSIQKDISSIPLSKVDFPKEVFMIVNKNIELEIKVLRDYPDWHFLPEDDLNRKTIQIFNELKIAKRDCTRDQKVLKVPNTDVFKITARILISKGITRIVNDDKLISL